MPLRKALFLFCTVVLVLCLAIGYGLAGHLMGAIVASLIGAAWWLARKYPNSGLPLVCLFLSVGLAVVGRFIGAPALLMIFGSAVALAVWDILLLDSSLGINSSFARSRQYENKHLQSLALALGCGLLVTFLGRLSNIQIPFIVLLLFTTFLLFAMDRVWGYIKKTGKR